MPYGSTNIDATVRLKAFEWLEEQCTIYGETLPRTILEKGFLYNETRVPLIGPQGIFIPKVMGKIPLSITTSPNSPYDDEHSSDGFLMYKYRGTDPHHRENAGLREAMLKKIPLIYLSGVVPGKYLPSWPVYIVRDDPSTLTFTVAVDEKHHTIASHGEPVCYDAPVPDEDSKRKYLTIETRQRLHQQRFRERVIAAYREQCAMCQLRHPELLDATHIIPDNEPQGDPVVPNGIALCKLHHAAFDRFIVGIRPDYIIHVRSDILEEEDGPMLDHGLKRLDGQKLILPRTSAHLPDPERLEMRYSKFKSYMVN
ncbi:MAG: HNH endonuclease [Candidatus Omnitrophica bacterium]|nr:HNH endonuclease [Candidatus Omnitrophota bacterium]